RRLQDGNGGERLRFCSLGSLHPSSGLPPWRAFRGIVSSVPSILIATPISYTEVRQEQGGIHATRQLPPDIEHCSRGAGRTAANPWHDGLPQRIRAKWQRFRAGLEREKGIFRSIDREARWPLHS